MVFFRIMHFSGYTVIAVLGLGVFSIITSFFLPGKVPGIDYIRVTLQRKMLLAASNIYYGNVTLDETGRHIPGGEILTYDMLLPRLSGLKPGDVFCTESTYFLAAAITPGKWKHVGVFLGTKQQVGELYGEDSPTYEYISRHYVTGEEILVLDSSKTGVSIRDFKELSGLGSVSFLRSFAAFNCLDSGLCKYLIDSGITHIGKSYDYDLRLDEQNSIYCAQLIYDGLKGYNLQILPSGQYLARKVLTPQDIYDFCDRESAFEKAMDLYAENGELYDMALLSKIA